MNRDTLILSTIIVFLIIIVAYIAFAFGSNISKPQIVNIEPTTTPTPMQIIITQPPVSPSLQLMSPTDVVNGFYASYEDCLKDPPPAASGQVSIYCQSNNPFITGTFVTNLERGGTAQAGADPVVCAQTLPQNITTGTATINGNSAQIQITEIFSAGNAEQITVNLVNQLNGWKIDNVTCPSPWS